MSQMQKLLELLRQRGTQGVTPIEALDIVGTFRLSAGIYDLRADGHDIRSHTHRTPSGSDVARYVLVPPQPEQMTFEKFMAGIDDLLAGNMESPAARRLTDRRSYAHDS